MRVNVFAPTLCSLSLTFLCLLLTLASAATESPAPTAPPRLLFVAELCRHGDRTPIKEFPSDALPVSKWPEGLGELTAVGQRAHFQLGQRLRARYVDTGFLQEAFNPRHIYVRSTDVDRTLTSAVSQMAGLFPPGTAPNPDVRVRFGHDPLHENEGGLPHLYQPVPIHTTSVTTDMLLLPGANCPRHAYIMLQKSLSSDFKAKVASEKNFLQAAAAIAGVDKNNFTIFDLDHLSDTWTCFAAHSVPLPDAATPDIVDHARNLSNWLLTFGNKGLEVNRLRAGLVLHEIATRIAAAALLHLNKLPAIAASLPKKFLLLSAHDTTLAATLSALTVFDGINPPYNSTILWELFVSQDNNFLVRLEYNGRPVLLPGCSDVYCPLQQYLESTQERTIPGEGARTIECLTGWRRFSAMATNAFRRRDNDPYLLQLPGDQSAPREGPAATLVIVAVGAVFCTVVAVAAMLRIRARYKGYAPALNEPMLPVGLNVRADSRTVSGRPILM